MYLMPFVTKQFEVEPGKRLSDQRHQGRAEVWVILRGRGQVELEDGQGKQHIWVGRGDQVIIPKMTWHRIKNVGQTRLVVREVQIGDCSESDIERRADDFGRA